MPEGLKCGDGGIHEITESESIDFGSLVGFLHRLVSILIVSQQVSCQ